MQVKGTVIISIYEFVKSKFSEKYDEWFLSLNDDSKKVIKEIIPNGWYPSDIALVEPTLKVCEMFYNNDLRGSWEIGRFAADTAMKGVYRVFVKKGKPQTMIMRAGGILSSYYRPGDIKIVELKDNAEVLYFYNFEGMNELIEQRIAGWIERALEIHGNADIQLKINRSSSDGKDSTEMVVLWK